MLEEKTKPNKPEELKKVLNPTILKWFESKFKTFSLPQLFGVMEIHSRKNILVSAPTGATKTLTAFLAILNELVDNKERGILEDKIYAIYVSPLKALNEDIKHNLKNPLNEIEEITGKELGIRVGVRTGDTTQKEKADMLKNPPHILITTPESLSILLASKKFVDHLKDVQYCIVDEIHALAENKRGVHLSLALELLSYYASHMTRIGLSATVAPLEEIAKFLVGKDRPCTIVDVQFIKNSDLKVISPVDDLINTTFTASQSALYKLLHKMIQEHKTTLIFTNTRSATERVVHKLKLLYPSHYSENIGAHHGSLSKRLRHDIESKLRQGKGKVVVCSTSLELGLDIGSIDLVVCLSSPKSVARALQRIGRAGHSLTATTKGRIIVQDRDDLVECAVLLKAAMEKKIDRLHIPTLCLDVLAQQMYGFILNQVWEEKDLFEVITKSYCYQELDRKDFSELIDYLAGNYTSLQERHIYGKIWRKEGAVGRKGKMGRVIYMTNIGTIPDESFIQVKIGDQKVGVLDEGFLEKLKPGDIFVLGGATYTFKHARGMTAQVSAAHGKKPTIPSWFSENLPLSFDLAMMIGRFRRLVQDFFLSKSSKKDILKFIHDYLYVDDKAANSIYKYFEEQYKFCRKMGTDKTILVEHYLGEDEQKIIFHTMFGRRVNDCLSRAIAFILSKSPEKFKSADIGISDNGFFIASSKKAQITRAFEMLKSDKLDILMKYAIDKSEVLKRRFRHCAGRSLMILRNYKGKTKRAGRQQVSSMILLKAIQRISEEFCILKEARREVLEDLMDIKNTKKIIEDIESGAIQIKEIQTKIPSPFGLNLALAAIMDTMRMEDRMEFLKRMHEMTQAKISLEEAKAS